MDQFYLDDVMLDFKLHYIAMLHLPNGFVLIEMNYYSPTAAIDTRFVSFYCQGIWFLIVIGMYRDFQQM